MTDVAQGWPTRYQVEAMHEQIADLKARIKTLEELVGRARSGLASTYGAWVEVWMADARAALDGAPVSGRAGENLVAGAKGDGITDDSAAVQAFIDRGAGE